jgi:hypothetical protein
MEISSINFEVVYLLYGAFNMTAITLDPAPNAATLAFWEKHPPLSAETRTHVNTETMCWHLDRRPQTARIWAMRENGPLRPIRVNGRLAWPVAEIKRILGVAA